MINVSVKAQMVLPLKHSLAIHLIKTTEQDLHSLPGEERTTRLLKVCVKGKACIY